MFYSLPAGVSLIILSFAATVSSQSSSRLQQCWQTFVLAPTSGAHCVESDLHCICGSLNRNLNSLLECGRDTSQVSSLPPDNIRRAIDSRLISCSSSSNQNSVAISHPNLKTASNAAKDQIPINDLKARKREDDVLIKRDSIATPVAAQSTTAPTATPPTSFPLNNGMGTETLIPTYTDTPPLVVSVSPIGTSSPVSKATGSSGNGGGTLLDMSGTASTSGRRNKSLLGLTVCVLACVAWF